LSEDTPKIFVPMRSSGALRNLMSPVRLQREQVNSEARTVAAVVLRLAQLIDLNLKLVRPSRTLSLSMRSSLETRLSFT